MTILEKLRLLFKLETTVKAVEQGITMKNSTKVLTAIVGLVTAVLQVPSVQHAVFAYAAAHPVVTTILSALSTILALLHVPVKDATKAAAVALFAALLLFPAPMRAQTADVQNLYAAGISYNAGASSPVAGSALYAHAATGSGTYVFSAVDALPATIKPFTVTTNIGAGVAQKVLTIAGKYPVFVPTSAGVSFSGTNTGWQWNAGAVVSIPIKGQYRIVPMIRFLKSSVSDGSGYQPIVGIAFGWAK